MGRITNWGTMLVAYDIRYMPYTAIKGQVVADFVEKFTKNMTEDGNEKIEVKMVLAFGVATWEVYKDRAAN